MFSERMYYMHLHLEKKIVFKGSFILNYKNSCFWFLSSLINEKNP